MKVISIRCVSRGFSMVWASNLSQAQGRQVEDSRPLSPHRGEDTHGSPELRDIQNHAEDRG